MDVIDKTEFERSVEKVKNSPEYAVRELVPAEVMGRLVDLMDSPTQAQRILAAQISFWLEKQMEDDIKENGRLSAGTRQWVETYNAVLANLHSNLHGSKSMNINLTGITHADIAEVIRKHPSMSDKIVNTEVVKDDIEEE